jgi:hypothetical protein
MTTAKITLTTAQQVPLARHSTFFSPGEGEAPGVSQLPGGK